MPKVLVVYYSRGGNTAKMAEAVGKGAGEVVGVEVEIKKAQEATPGDLVSADGIIMGSPVYFGTMAAELKKVIDESITRYGKLDGKAGGAFASSGVLGGGNETAVLDILKALLIHGMIVKGSVKGAHYGAVAIGAPDEKALKECAALGRSVAELTKKLSASRESE
jgi:NAD(P)H dehydrogenase (quinone)